MITLKVILAASSLLLRERKSGSAIPISISVADHRDEDGDGVPANAQSLEIRGGRSVTSRRDKSDS